MYTYPIYIKLACMIRMITLILPLCCLCNPERHELARGIYIIREVYIAMFVIRIIQLTIAFNHSYHTCKFDIDLISILLKISKINANFDIIAACSSSPSLLLLPFASCSYRNLALNHSIIIEISRKIAFGTTWVWRGLRSMNKGPNATICLVRRQNHAGTTVSWTTVQREKSSHAYKLSSNVQTACSTDSLNNCPKHSILRFSSFALKIYL